MNTDELLDALQAERGTYRITSERYSTEPGLWAPTVARLWLQLGGTLAAQRNIRHRLQRFTKNNGDEHCAGQDCTSFHLILEVQVANAQELRALLASLLGPLHQLVS